MLWFYETCSKQWASNRNPWLSIYMSLLTSWVTLAKSMKHNVIWYPHLYKLRKKCQSHKDFLRIRYSHGGEIAWQTLRDRTHLLFWCYNLRTSFRTSVSFGNQRLRSQLLGVSCLALSKSLESSQAESPSLEWCTWLCSYREGPYQAHIWMT